MAGDEIFYSFWFVPLIRLIFTCNLPCSKFARRHCLFSTPPRRTGHAAASSTPYHDERETDMNLHLRCDTGGPPLLFGSRCLVTKPKAWTGADLISLMR
ncbi:hypothetical protein ZWY2020_040390 [Hordeum vulgare]|nr:hypothetical protein ZWY2020_040390 [Hordeum vulgare]